jgi:hypothetical protein
LSTVSFPQKGITFCYSGFTDRNFEFENHGDDRPRLYMVDVEHASFLPIRFLAYAAEDNFLNLSAGVPKKAIKRGKHW